MQAAGVFLQDYGWDEAPDAISGFLDGLASVLDNRRAKVAQENDLLDKATQAITRKG